jgi:AcrR family transcriptional regulator
VKRNQRQSNEAITALLPLISTSKSQLRKFQIIEGAVRCYAKMGLDKTTFDQIAKEAKTSRSLLLHYFKTKEEILFIAAQYVRKLFQERAITAIQKGRSTMEMLDLYIKSCFDWVDEEPDHVTFWLLFFNLTITVPKFKRLNTEMTTIGQARLAGLLEKAYSEGKITKGDFAERARLIQTNINGAIIQIVTEENTHAQQAAFKASVLQMCRKVAGQKA